jgi:hypothetical protein
LAQQRLPPSVAGTQALVAHCPLTEQVAPGGRSGLQVPWGVLQPFAHCAALSHCTQPWPVLRQKRPAPHAWLQQTWAPPPAVASQAPETQSEPSALVQD